ncbi:MAG: dipeptidase [Caldilineae bacterium]|nr:MAG: dipeptidase [Caldilineae bacterium]
MTSKALTHAQNNRSLYLDWLKALLAIPSISAQREHAADVRRAAEWLLDKMQAIGLQKTAIYPTPGHPIVYGEWLEAGPQAPTVLIYGHYDVQPPDPLDEWETPPFEPTIRGDDIFARGATDDKGQLLTHLAAVDALLRAEGALPVNVKFFIEGEEEIGGEHLDDFIAAHTDLLAADCGLISDTAIAAPDQPVIVYGLRGLVYFEVTVRSAEHDLHSGIYGGAIHNPLNALAAIIAAMHDETGRITIPGFYEDVLPLTESERVTLEQIPDTYLEETGARKLWGEPQFTARERTTARPSFDVHGIVGGYTAEGQKTVIPARATAKMSLRLAPNQDPLKAAEQFTRHIQNLAPDTVTVTVERKSYGYPALIDRDDPAIVAAANAYRAAFGNQPLFRREGGSIPVVATLQRMLNLPVAMMGFGLPDDRLHAPNEKFHLPNFYRGIEASIHFLREYARLTTR